MYFLSPRAGLITIIFQDNPISTQCMCCMYLMCFEQYENGISSFQRIWVNSVGAIKMKKTQDTGTRKPLRRKLHWLMIFSIDLSYHRKIPPTNQYHCGCNIFYRLAKKKYSEGNQLFSPSVLIITPLMTSCLNVKNPGQSA